jgi:hypothetical protein
MDDELKVKE